MLSFNLTPIFKVRGIERPYSFLVKAGFTSHMANIIVSDKAKTLNLAHIETLCKILVCEPNDLLKFTPNKDNVYPQNHPLLKLQTTELTKTLDETLFTMPYKQLKQLTEQIQNNNL
jgi:DNA-binding Xre family transcriptional regulator